MPSYYRLALLFRLAFSDVPLDCFRFWCSLAFLAATAGRFLLRTRCSFQLDLLEPLSLTLLWGGRKDDFFGTPVLLERVPSYDAEAVSILFRFSPLPEDRYASLFLKAVFAHEIKSAIKGRVDLLQWPFFDLNLEVDNTVDNYMDCILFTLVSSIEEHLPSGQWRIIGHPPASSSPATSPASNTVGTSCFLAASLGQLGTVTQQIRETQGELADFRRQAGERLDNIQRRWRRWPEAAEAEDDSGGFQRRWRQWSVAVAGDDASDNGRRRRLAAPNGCGRWRWRRWPTTAVAGDGGWRWRATTIVMVANNDGGGDGRRRLPASGGYRRASRQGSSDMRLIRILQVQVKDVKYIFGPLDGTKDKIREYLVV
ncbi:hypothetical protein M5K25_017270 [Dendrobium thyrsiflorum]|uniref:Uncharacterized protein n=1 Tax=Dendrobium thyrsiflorum TaxID=117978 RepID=A0ABD0UUG8_DENTH